MTNKYLAILKSLTIPNVIIFTVGTGVMMGYTSLLVDSKEQLISTLPINALVTLLVCVGMFIVEILRDKLLTADSQGRQVLGTVLIGLTLMLTVFTTAYIYIEAILDQVIRQSV